MNVEGPVGPAQTRPSHITLAAYFIYGATAAGLVPWLASRLADISDFYDGLAALFAGIILFGIPILLGVKIATGHNWARYVFVALALLSLPSQIPFIRDIGALPLVAYIGVFSWALDIAAVCLLCRRSTSAWFREQTTRRKERIVLSTSLALSAQATTREPTNDDKRQTMGAYDRRSVLAALASGSVAGALAPIAVTIVRLDACGYSLGAIFSPLALCIIPTASFGALAGALVGSTVVRLDKRQETRGSRAPTDNRAARIVGIILAVVVAIVASLLPALLLAMPNC